MRGLIEELKNSRLALIRAVDNFPKDKREEILFNKWSLKDVMAHVSGWDNATIDLLKKIKKGKTPEWIGSVYGFNRRSVEKRKKWSWQKVYKEFVRVGREIVGAYESVPKELWEKRVWENRGFTPKKFIKIDIRHYRNEHLPQIMRFVRQKGT